MTGKTYYCTRPDEIMYMPLPDGSADVWLRKEITEGTGDDDWNFCADEVYFHTTLTRDEVVARFDELFETEGEGYSEAEDDETDDLTARIAALEDQLAAAKILLGVE